MTDDLIARAEYAIEHGSGDALHRQLVAELKATRLFFRQVAEALGFLEIVDGVDEVVTGSDGDLLDNLRHFADTARDHVNCPVWCDDCEHFEQPDSCGRCAGGGCGPGTASGAYDPCRDCDGDGRDHNFAYVHAPDLEAELKATRAQLEQVTRLAEKWETATELGTGTPSVVTRAFAAEIRGALEQEPDHGWQNHLADVPLSTPGTVIVELPRRTLIPNDWNDGCMGAWRARDGLDPVSAWTGGQVATPAGEFMPAADARALAAALLAAAAAAEAADNG
ncbi:hypothetical protein VIMS_02479 [Mycobacterium marinum]|uniref:hypothetical protein n=1 Tax=Mycobacterium marinum TaxID=1781 RepID=UPI000E3DF3BF|nr:hypothetical protein [Mycobacterium marinum]RFZ15049.1 hypothetical protein VIMS_02479 [Mycobacterium marinum]